MKIGLFTDTYPPYINGVSTSVLILKKALEKKGHQVYVVTINKEKIAYAFEDDNKIIRIPGIPVGIYNYRISGIYPLKAIKHIKKWKLDIIHCHTEFSVGTFARLIAKRFGIPLVHTYHTMYEDYAHYITKGYFNGISKELVKYFTLFYCDKTISELVVPTKKTYDLFKEKYKVKRNIYIVPTGIEIDTFRKVKFNKKGIFDLKRSLGINKQDFILLFVGRIATEKNIPFLIEAQKKLVKECPNIKLVILGDGPEINKLTKQASHKDYQGSIIFAGEVSLSEVPIYYQMANISVTASKSETQGLTVIEALASGVPVVCANDESFRNMVIDDLNGYLFDNKKQYQDIIIDLYQDKEKLDRLQKQALISGNEHSSTRYAEKILDVYTIAIENYIEKKITIFKKIRKGVGL